MKARICLPVIRFTEAQHLTPGSMTTPSIGLKTVPISSQPSVREREPIFPPILVIATEDKNVSVLAVNTLGVLYLVENGDSIQSVDDLKGKTIYASGKGATPEYALNSVLKSNGLDPEKDVTIEYKSEHAEVVAALAEDQTAVGLLPQPFVTTALMKNENLRVALDLNELWESSATDGSRLVTGVVIARNDYLKEHEADIDAFMDAYKDSVEFVNSDTEAAAQIIGNHDIIPAEVAAKAIPECSIVFMEGDEMQTILSGYLNTLNEQNPETIGGQLPDEDFYYKR